MKSGNIWGNGFWMEKHRILFPEQVTDSGKNQVWFGRLFGGNRCRMLENVFRVW